MPRKSSKRLAKEVDGILLTCIIIIVLAIIGCCAALGTFIYYTTHWKTEGPSLQLFDPKSAPHVHVSMTTVPERFVSEWFAKNVREHINSWKGNFTIWCNVPPNFKGQPYTISKHVKKLLTDFPETFRLYFCSKDWGPITKILGSVENPSIGIDDPILVIDDDQKYKEDLVLHAATYTSYDPTKVYTFCKAAVYGYRGWATTKRQCIDIPNNMPPSCFRIDDDLLDQYFAGRIVSMPYTNRNTGSKDRHIFCSHQKFGDPDHPNWKHQLRHDFRLPMQNRCKKDFWSGAYEKNQKGTDRASKQHVR